MIQTTIKWNEYPFTVKAAILSLALGWLLHLTFYYKFLIKEQLTRNDYLMIGVGVGICFFVATINKWARPLCIFFNLGIMAMYAIILFFGQSGFDRRVLEILVVASYALSTYFLLQKDTATFYKTFNQPTTPETPAE